MQTAVTGSWKTAVCIQTAEKTLSVSGVVTLWRPLLLGYQQGAGKIRTTRPGDPVLRPNGLGEGMPPCSKLGVIRYLLARVVTWRSGAHDF